jgi:hypothetical protein
MLNKLRSLDNYVKRLLCRGLKFDML